MGRQDWETETLIPVTGGGFDDADAIIAELRRLGVDVSPCPDNGTEDGDVVPRWHIGDYCSNVDGLREHLESLMEPTAFRTSPNCGAWETGDRTDALTTGTDPSAHLIAHSLRGEGFDASEDGTGRGTPIVPVYAIQERAVSENITNGPQGKGYQEGVAYTLEARHHVQAVAFDTTQITSPGNYSSPAPGDPCHPLAATAHPPAVAFAQNQRDEVREMDVAGALAAEPGMKQQTYVAYQCQGTNVGEMGTLRAGNGNQTGGVPFVQQRTGVRRLTPRECERLQGLQMAREIITINVCLDHQKNSVLVALQCRKWLESASDAGGQGSFLHAGIADASLSTSQVGRESLAALRVHTQSVDELLEIHSHGRCVWSASSAGNSGLSLHPGLIESSARALAQVGRELVQATRIGKAESLQSIRLSSPARSGASSAKKYGVGIAASVSDATKDASPEKFTTSELGSLVPSCDLSLATLLCSVLHAISGCIPEETLPANFSLELDVATPYTSVLYRGKPAADGPRYQAIGNSMAVPVIRWIGERIERYAH